MHISPAAGASPTHGHWHAKPANFGTLNSAVARGDLPSAQSALEAISAASNPAAKALMARANIDDLRQAMALNDIDATRLALAKIRSHDVSEPTSPVTTTPQPAPEAPVGQTAVSA